MKIYNDEQIKRIRKDKAEDDLLIKSAFAFLKQMENFRDFTEDGGDTRELVLRNYKEPHKIKITIQLMDK